MTRTIETRTLSWSLTQRTSSVVLPTKLRSVLFVKILVCPQRRSLPLSQNPPHISLTTTCFCISSSCLALRRMRKASRASTEVQEQPCRDTRKRDESSALVAWSTVYSIRERRGEISLSQEQQIQRPSPKHRRYTAISSSSMMVTEDLMTTSLTW